MYTEEQIISTIIQYIQYRDREKQKGIYNVSNWKFKF